jgi:hypothetical protein
VKRQTPIMCVIGNPPYSGESANKGDHIMGLMEDYKKEPGTRKLKERNPKWLNDDYVKFIRMSEHLIEKNGEGVLGFITNHGYLDNPTFRGTCAGIRSRRSTSIWCSICTAMPKRRKSVQTASIGQEFVVRHHNRASGARNFVSVVATEEPSDRYMPSGSALSTE